MTDDTHNSESGDTRPAAEPAGGRTLSAAARRALAEAEERRNARKALEQQPERELGGRGGADPARFGDWEIDGRAIDF
ncbi:MAG: DUF1674 domain-containing protein [Hoeflea sp.]|uniref:DUF1674 domain-containing protein n=1 Tax=Hoeflea sp. TaxID=1940281 RepID=UPI0032F00259